MDTLTEAPTTRREFNSGPAMIAVNAIMATYIALTMLPMMSWFWFDVTHTQMQTMLVIVGVLVGAGMIWMIMRIREDSPSYPMVIGFAVLFAMIITAVLHPHGPNGPAIVKQAAARAGTQAKTASVDSLLAYASDGDYRSVVLEAGKRPRFMLGDGTSEQATGRSLGRAGHVTHVSYEHPLFTKVSESQLQAIKVELGLDATCAPVKEATACVGSAREVITFTL